tara:strand:+ start:313 stop:981 length:669 start_codon:yes stop_codon:yes gene_type:complete
MKTISDNTSYEAGVQLINATKYSSWIFSYGGCGTNFLRRLFLLYRFKNVKKPSLLDIIRSIHVFTPPRNIDNKNFVGIYIFGNPILSVASICRRRIAKTINVLAGKSIFSRNNDVNIEELLDTDILRLEEHLYNWMNTDVNYPIVFIKYEDLSKEKIYDICQDIKNKYNIDFKEDIISRFKERRSSYDTIEPGHLEKLKKIYSDFEKKVQELPSYWIKEPTH